MSEWIVNSEDLGCDGAYFSYTEVVRCRDCKFFKELTIWGERETFCFSEEGLIFHPKEDDFCSWGVRK